MTPVLQTKLLLIVVLAGTIVSTAAWEWTGAWGILATYGGALVAGMAAGRITRLMLRASA